jgi:hypothetical protein
LSCCSNGDHSQEVKNLKLMDEVISMMKTFFNETYTSSVLGSLRVVAFIVPFCFLVLTCLSSILVTLCGSLGSSLVLVLRCKILNYGCDFINLKLGIICMLSKN